MKVKLADVTKVVAPPQDQKAPGMSGKKSRSRSTAKSKSTRTAVKLDTNTVDLRGLRVYEVGDKLTKAIDRALEFGTLYVVHGRGSGSLRSYVREVLADEPCVESFEDASEAEGGNGCTIAYLR